MKADMTWKDSDGRAMCAYLPLVPITGSKEEDNAICVYLSHDKDRRRYEMWFHLVHKGEGMVRYALFATKDSRLVLEKDVPRFNAKRLLQWKQEVLRQIEAEENTGEVWAQIVNTCLANGRELARELVPA